MLSQLVIIIATRITEFEMIDTKNSSTAYVVMYKLIT